MSERTKQLKELQDIFNNYIRLRDYGKTCITCETVLIKEYDAGHCYPVSTYPELRVDEDNVHGQCKECNQFKGGLHHTFIQSLFKRIGSKKLYQLMGKRGHPLKLSLPEIKELKKIYRAKIREIEKDRV